MEAAYKPKLYLETTIFNFFSYGKAKQKQRDTRALFERIKAGGYEVYTSDYAVDELKDAPAQQFADMYALINTYGIIQLPRSEEAQRLGGIYMVRHIVPEEYPDDAYQIALASVEGLDCVVSWNMGHIVKQKAMIGTGLANIRAGYPQICLASPKEILEYDTATT
jgi:hypothetical protein